MEILSHCLSTALLAARVVMTNVIPHLDKPHFNQFAGSKVTALYIVSAGLVSAGFVSASSVDRSAGYLSPV